MISHEFFTLFGKGGGPLTSWWHPNPLRVNSWRSSDVPDHHRCDRRSQSLMVDHDVMTGGPCGKGGGHVSLPPLTSEPNVHNCLQMFAIMLQRALLCPLLMFSIGVTSYSPIVWHRPKGSSRIVWKCAQNNSAHTILYKLRKKLWDIKCRG